MARLKTRSISADRHRQTRIQSPAGHNSGFQDLSERPSETLSEEQPSLEYAIPAPRLKADLPLAETANPKPFSDLALDLVLNEIVLQARLTTNATGAVIALERSRKLACRATTGATSAEIATFLNVPSGISMTCFDTGNVRRVDDLGLDSNADSVAYQRSGVRSLLVVPVLNEENSPLGILESFSPRPSAFCDRDVLTLQALARRIATNIGLVSKASSVSHANASERLLQPPNRISEQAPRPSGRQSPAQLLTGSATAWRGTQAVWASMLWRTALVLVLLAACVSAGKSWLRSRGTHQAAALQRPAQIPVQQAANQSLEAIVVKPARPEINLSATKATAPAHAAASHLVSGPRARSGRHSGPSVTIERKPIHKDAASNNGQQIAADKAQAPSGEIVLFENRDPDPQDGQTQQPKSSSTLEGVETIPTQAAMARLVQRVEPEYPNAARQKRIQGTVLMDVVVNEDGAVGGLALVSGEQQLMPAAEQAVRQWHFQPLVKGGHAKKFESRININFTLASEGSSSGAR